MAKDKKSNKDGKKSEKTGEEDMRKVLAGKLERAADRIDTINRRFFGGLNEQIGTAHKNIVAAKAAAEALPKDWKPNRKGKKALIPGAIIMIKSDCPTDRMETYKHIGIERYVGSKIVKELDNRTFLVELKDGTKTLVPKRDVTPMEAAAA